MLIMDAVRAPYLEEKCNWYIRLLGVTARVLVKHLMDWYGNILPSALKESDWQANHLIDPSLPINIGFKYIDGVVQLATNRKMPYIVAQIPETGYYMVLSTGE